MIKSYCGNKYFWITIFFCLFLSSISYSKPAAIIARVNNQIITFQELENRIEFSKKYAPENKGLSKKSLTYNILDEIIEEYMINQEAKRVGISISDPELSQVMLQIKTSQSKLYKKFKQSNNPKLSTKIFEDKIKANIIWSKILSELVKPSISKINNPQIIETLEELDKDTQEFKFDIAEIKIKKSDYSKIIMDEIYKKLLKENKAKDVLETYQSQGININLIDIGWVSRADLDKNIYNILISNKSKKYTPCVVVNNDYAIFIINDKKLSNNITEKDYKIAQNKIYQSLKISDGQGFLQNLKKRTFIEIYRSRIDEYLNL